MHTVRDPTESGISMTVVKGTGVCSYPGTSLALYMVCSVTAVSMGPAANGQRFWSGEHS